MPTEYEENTRHWYVMLCGPSPQLALTCMAKKYGYASTIICK